MSVNDAKFLIQRSGSQYFCTGSDLYSKLQATDLLAIHRGGVLYRGTKDKVQDTDYLVCMDGGVTKKVAGSLVIPLLLPPPALAPIVTKINNTVWNQTNVEPYSVTELTEVTLSVETSSESSGLAIEYWWTLLSGNGQFTSSPGSRIVTFEAGPVGDESYIACTIAASGASDNPQTSDVIRILAT